MLFKLFDSSEQEDFRGVQCVYNQHFMINKLK